MELDSQFPVRCRKDVGNVFGIKHPNSDPKRGFDVFSPTFVVRQLALDRETKRQHPRFEDTAKPVSELDGNRRRKFETPIAALAKKYELPTYKNKTYLPTHTRY